MSVVRAQWLWPVTIMVTAVCLMLSTFAFTVYRASGVNHGTTYYACLYAGSLSQVGTAPPSSCGRGQQISWNSTGVQGPEGPQGEPATALWAVVHFFDGEVVRGTGEGVRLNDGQFRVIFDRDVSMCAYVATVGTTDTTAPNFGVAAVTTYFLDPNSVLVRTFGQDGNFSDRSFHLAVFCPAAEG